jgi:tRNA modification GTPase
MSSTICALATPPGVAGLAVIRISGPEAVGVCAMSFRGAEALTTVADHTIHYGWWVDGDRRIDAVTATVFRNPHSYTGEDVVEVGCHGGPFVVEQILSSLHTAGIRPAEPGEFTRRAFINGKLDLTQVEAVADLIHAQTRVGAQTAARQLAGGFTKKLSHLREQLLSASGLLEVELDFSEEGYEFVSRSAFAETLDETLTFTQRLVDSAASAEVLRSGFYAAVVGFPNAGKSSLFNALLDRPRAIVSHIPGTTRDYLEESVIIDGYTIHLYDTAGLRNTEDTIELQGILLTDSLLEQSDLILVVNDAAEGFDHSDALAASLRDRYQGTPLLIVQNKMDLVEGLVPPNRGTDIPSSSKEFGGIEHIRKQLVAAVKHSSSGIQDILVNARQAALLRTLAQHLASARQALDVHAPADLIAIDIRAAVRIMGELSGETWNPDVLDTVFSRFCIGK